MIGDSNLRGRRSGFGQELPWASIFEARPMAAAESREADRPSRIGVQPHQALALLACGRRPGRRGAERGGDRERGPSRRAARRRVVRGGCALMK